MESNSSAKPPRISLIAEVGLRVDDLAKMRDFYQEVLGFEVAQVGPNHVFLKIGDLPSSLGAIGHAQLLVLFDRETTPDTRVSSLDHLAFEIPPEDYPAELAKFQAKGMVLRERAWPDTLDWRARSFFFHDPEGNVIELIAALDEAAGPSNAF